MTPPPVPTRPTRSRGRAAALAAVVALLAAACWFAWMGWDAEYQTDPVTGEVSGPYEAWQVLGCVLSLVLVTVPAVRVLGGRRAVLVVTAAFTVAWSIAPAATDESGLWLVGAILVLVGTAAGTSLVALVVRLLRRRPSGVAAG